MSDERFVVVNNYYRGLCVVDKSISSKIEHGFMDNIIESDCCPYTLVEEANNLVVKNNQLVSENKKLEKKIKSLKEIIRKQEMDRMSCLNLIGAVSKWGVKAPCFKEDGSFDEKFYPPNWKES